MIERGHTGLRTCVARLLRLAIAGAATIAGNAASAAAEPDPGAPVTLSIRNTTDLWGVAAGGIKRGSRLLNKLQLMASFDGEAVGLTGFHAHGQIFRTDGKSLTSLVGDVETVSNIEAVNTARLFEAWVEQSFGTATGGGSIRAGLIDLNSEFDSIDPAGLFINSSHGVGPDISKSGRNGPSIFPVSSAGIRAAWVPSSRWLLRVAVFDGVSGAPDHPKAFVAVRLRGSDGALAIAEANYRPGGDTTVAIGAWHYSGTFDRADGSPAPKSGDSGLYGYVEGGLPGLDGWSGWMRAGIADSAAQAVGGYMGAGLVARGVIGDREDDQFGVAVSHAIIGREARDAYRLPHAETTIEASYQCDIGHGIAVQPDLQYVIHPASQPGIGHALVLGLRVSFSASNARMASAPASPADPRTR